MGLHLRLDRVELLTSSGSSTYEFRAGLNAVVGSYGTGKSSLFELIKFAFGGNAELMPAIQANVLRVQLDLTVGDEQLRLAREVGRNQLAVSDRRDEAFSERWTTTSGNLPRAGLRLLELLGLPLTRLPRRGSSGATSEALTFNDLFRYVYLPQNDVDRSVAGHADTFLNRKRKAVFEFAYGLTNDRLRSLEVEHAELEQQRNDARIAANAVNDFLRSAGRPDQQQLDQDEREASAELRESGQRLTTLREGSRAATSDQAELRARIGTLRLALADAERDRASAYASVEKSRSLIAQLSIDEAREERTATAATTLTGLEFVVCPRCLQRVGNRELPPDTCLLCTQPEPAGPDATSTSRRASRQIVERLKAQRAEAEQLMAEDERLHVDAQSRVEGLRQELESAAGDLERQAGDIVAPSMDEATELAAAIERARARLHECERTRQLWDALNDQQREIERLDSLLIKNEEAQAKIQSELSANRERVTELAEVFDEEIRELQWAGYETATIDADTYLPIINGDTFNQLSVGGARKTLANVAYYVSNLGYSLSNPDIALPDLLMIDSPRKNLGDTPEDRAAGLRLYYRLGILAQAYPDAQILIADNGLPELDRETRNRMNVIELSYQEPLLRDVPHPGGDKVETVGTSSKVST